MLLSPPALSTDDHEARRLHALRWANLLDTGAEPSFDQIAELAAVVCGTPMAQINFVDESRVWTKATYGLERLSVPREITFCSHTIQAPGQMEVENAPQDPRFCDNPFVAGPPGIHFYAGVRLLSADGYALGVLCVFDLQPRRLTEAQWRALHLLASAAEGHILYRVEAEAFDSFFKSGPAPMAICVADQTIANANPAWCRLFGCQEPPMSGRQVSGLVAPEDQPAFLLWWQQINSAQTFAPLEVRAIHKNGKALFLQIEAAKVGTRVYLVASDITARKEAMQAAAVQQQKLDMALDAAQIGIWELSLSTLKVQFSPQCKVLLGYEATGLSDDRERLAQLVHPEDLAELRMKFKNEIANREGLLRAELRLLHGSGGFRHFAIIGKIFSFTNKKPDYVIGILVDISARKTTEKRLKISEAQLKASLEYTPNVAVQWYNRAGEVLYWNQASEQLYGWTASEAIGKTLDQLILSPDEAAAFRNILQTIEATQLPHGPFESEICHRNGTPGFVLATTFAIPSERGEAVFVCMDVDISERKRMEQQLIEKNAEQEQLLRFTRIQNDRMREYTYITSHNLRSPIASMLGLSALIQQQPEEYEKYVKLMITCVEQLDNTITNMNDLLAIETERQSMPWVVLNLASVVQNSCDLIQGFARGQAEILTDVPSTLEVRVIPAYLDSILNNLITNAIKYRKLDQIAKIEVICHRINDAVEILVRDNGIGIDLAADGHRLFKMQSRITRQADGKGLGLFFTKYHVEAMGGQISVESTPGIGTTFRVLLYDTPENLN